MIYLTSCNGGGSSDNMQESTVVLGVEDTNIPVIDTSKSLTEGLQKIFSNLNANSSFYGLRIKKISHPSKFVGTWTMWRNFRADKTTINQDGTCGDELFYFKTGKRKKSNCLQWYHVSFGKDKNALLFVYPNDYTLLSYEWVDKDNIYFYYYDGDGHLATRANSTPFAKNIEDRFLLGTWVEEESDLSVFWTFYANNKFLVETYTTKDNRLVVDKQGTWHIDKTKVTISVDGDRNSENGFIRRSLPPKEINLDFLYGIERLGYRGFKRWSEPLMIKSDPYIGKFQGHSTYNSYNTISLNISKKSTDNYLVDIFWNNKSYPENSATKIDGLLHVSTEFGTIIFKATINGIQKINILEDNLFNFPERILRVSQDPKAKEKNIVGRWVQSVHYSIPERYRYFTFLENGKFFHRNGDYQVNIGREGTYRKVGDKLYLKPRCGKEEKVEDIILNEAHFSPSSYGELAFIKIKDSQALSSLWYALRSYEVDYKKRLTKLIPHPKYKGKFLFSKEIEYAQTGYLSMIFKPNGEMTQYSSGQYQTFDQDYYIEVSNDIEKIVLLKSTTSLFTTSNPKPLKLYDARQTICYDDKWELGQEK